MNGFKWTLASALCVAVGFANVSDAQVLIADDFEVDSSANYTVLDDSNAANGDGAADSTSQFAFDYIAAGIPLAPNSQPGDVGGLRFTANATEEGPEGPTSSEEDHIGAFHNTTVTGQYVLSVDIYMGVEAFPGTTEYAHVGVAGDPNVGFNSLFNPLSGSGHFVAFNGDGDSASDYRHSTPSTLAVPSGDASYLNDANTTNATGDTYQNLFPNTSNPGSPTNIWTTLTVTVLSDTVTYALDGVPIIQTATEATDGAISLGYADLFDSVGPHFGIYDNLTVTAIPEPTAAMLSLLGLTVLGARRSRQG